MKSRTIVPIVAAIIALVAIWLILSPADNADNSDMERVAVRLKWLHQAQFAGFYVADKKGFYEDEGLDVALNPGGVDFPAIQMVAGGGEQFGVTGADQILIARSKGVPIVALAVIYRKSPMVFFSLSDERITTPKDFEGHRVGVKYGGNEELTYRALLRKAGVDASKIAEIPVKYDMSPLFSGDVEVWPGYAINEPIVAQERGHSVNIIWPSDYGVYLYADALFATEELIRDRPDLVQRFVRATLKGWEYAVQNPSEAVDYALTYSDNLNAPHESAMMAASLDLLKPDARPIGTMDASVWKGMEDLLLEGGSLKSRTDIEEVYTTRFIE
ncbi:thiamine biosynthesis protein [Candidatus Peregrinibacteria bacterium CG10_big_fil_rev_8_21_14_0_10_54_7]|nr:MAG: thiamine biosynthesis protein [Candidatus Peregrinibacteria bacterium CG10_big_fil_rev_8_21_14_0_10_54_7]